MKVIFDGITETNITLVSLDVFTEYNVEVAAGTFVGFGQGADAVVRTLRERKFAFQTMLCFVGVFFPNYYYTDIYICHEICFSSLGFFDCFLSTSISICWQLHYLEGVLLCAPKAKIIHVHSFAH